MLSDLIKPEAGSIYNQLTAREIYEHNYGISEIGRHNPFAIVSVSPKEDCVSGGLLERHYRDFIMLDVHKYLGFDFDSYLARPMYEINMINKILKEVKKELKTSTDNQDKELKRSMEEMKSNLNKDK